jgi:hypothetical protein
MKTLPAYLLLLGVMSVSAASPAVSTGVSSPESRHRHAITSFETMYGVDGPFIGDANPIRGVIGDELPWEIAHSVRGELDTAGHLRIIVIGLVFKDDPSVPPELRGINDEAQFRGLVSCLTEVGDTVQTQNVVTGGFPASRRGNSFINATIHLPNPCVAPVVMVLAGSEDKWFAASGVEIEQDNKLAQ